ncbi:hypothetical protein [Pseudoalteromonas sp. BDTF-M6]|uniref:hypothetical protein n=1 Tax=Pseudoalteromonas sp. BDTF-M6 TaxID=2796132 RepID=UPI001BB00132|nr:hypothetical protein [Pseudoalteromonas sp. BDTF-M6]MBS3796145.1 hypothetical protein [Pseudoalteromonas sp. BDTF-M6]
MMKLFIVSVVLLFGFVALQNLERPPNELRVTDEEIGMSLESQNFSSKKEIKSYIEEMYSKKEEMIKVKIEERKEKLQALKVLALALLAVALISVFVIKSVLERLFYAALLVIFSIIEWSRFTFSGFVIGLLVIASIQVVFFIFSKEGKLPAEKGK